VLPILVECFLEYMMSTPLAQENSRWNAEG
jgi:hypothetical protein